MKRTTFALVFIEPLCHGLQQPLSSAFGCHLPQSGRLKTMRTPKPSPRMGKGDREAVEEVHGLTGKNNT